MLFHSSVHREAFEYQTPSLTIHNSKAILQFQDSKQTLSFDLFKVPLSEARILAQDLVFGLVEQVQKLEKHVKGSVFIHTCWVGWGR